MSSSSQKPCPTCKGGRAVQTPDGSQWQKCPNCEGQGSVKRSGLFYTYRTPPTLVAGNGTANVIITIVNWDFLWLELTGDYTSINFTFLITDVGSTRNFSPPATQIAAADMVGTGQNPFPLLTPYTFAKQSQIQVSLTDTSGANNTIALCFIGENLGESATS